MQGNTCLLSLLPCRKDEKTSPTDEYGLLKGFETEYNKNVVSGHKSYGRFVDDAINGLSFVSVNPNTISASVCNEIVKVYGRVATLLVTRQDLVKGLYEYLGTNPKSVEEIMSLLDADKKLPPPKKPLQLSEIQLYRLAQLVRRLGFFSAYVDGKTLESMLDGSLTSPIQVSYGKMIGLAAMLSRLAYQEMIPTRWQHIITANGMIKSSTGKSLVATKFSNAVQRSGWTKTKEALVKQIINETDAIIKEH